MSPRLALLFFTVFITSVLPAVAEKRIALLMGVSDYSRAPGISNLPGITTDLAMMEKALRQLGFTVYRSDNPTLGQAKRAIDAFGQTLRRENGTGLFYFSGHGAELDGRNYLIPSNANLFQDRDLPDEALSAQRILNRMQESGSRTNLVFLDCCRNEFTKSIGRGFSPMTADGIFIGFATGDNTSAGATKSGSIYTRHLVKHLVKPGFSIADMHTLVTRDVKKASPAQNPYSYSGLDQIYYLAGRSPQTSPTPTAPGQLRTVTQLLAEHRRNNPPARTASLTPPDELFRNKTERPAPPNPAPASQPAPPDPEAPHQQLKSRAENTTSGKASIVYGGEYDGEKALVALQYHPGGILNGAMFLLESHVEVRLYGDNSKNGVLTLSMWESDNPLDFVRMEKSTTTEEIIWAGRTKAQKVFAFARQRGRKAKPASSNYMGSVGRSKVSAQLRWQTNGTVTGHYKSHSSGRNYRLAGDNLIPGFVYLDEFTDGTLSARLMLKKLTENGKLTWKGALYNVKGPRRQVTFQR